MSDSGKKRVVVIGLSHPFRGGIAHYSTLFVRELRRRHEVSFITFYRQYPDFLFPGTTQFDDSSKPLVEDNDQRIDSMNPLSWYRTAKAINQWEPDLIVIQWWHPFFAPAFGMITRFLHPSLKSRVCFLCHNVLPHESSPLQRLLTRFAFRHSRFFVVHSQQDEQQLTALQKGGSVKRGCHPTYSEFANYETYTSEKSRETLAIPDERKVILFFGLIRGYKGLHVLIDAMQKVVARLPCHLVIAGEFYDDSQPYLDRILAKNLDDYVTLVDRYIPNEELAMYFSGAEVVVLPYLSATQSGIVQVAFGFETPVITTNVGGLPEAVDHGRTGLVVEPDDAGALADAIVEFFEQGYGPRFREEIVNQTERFDWSQELKHIDHFLDQFA